MGRRGICSEKGARYIVQGEPTGVYISEAPWPPLWETFLPPSPLTPCHSASLTRNHQPPPSLIHPLVQATHLPSTAFCPSVSNLHSPPSSNPPPLSFRLPDNSPPSFTIAIPGCPSLQSPHAHVRALTLPRPPHETCTTLRYRGLQHVIVSCRLTGASLLLASFCVRVVTFIRAHSHVDHTEP